MLSSKSTYELPSAAQSLVVKEEHIEYGFVGHEVAVLLAIENHAVEDAVYKDLQGGCGEAVLGGDVGKFLGCLLCLEADVAVAEGGLRKAFTSLERADVLGNGHVDTVIGLPANLFYSTGIPVCILVLKKCKKPDEVLFINAAEHFVKGKRQNQLTGEHIAEIIKTYQFRNDVPRYSRKVEMAEIEKNDFNLNISRYISTAVGEVEIALDETHQALVEIEKAIAAAKNKHNAFLRELDLKPLP